MITACGKGTAASSSVKGKKLVLIKRPEYPKLF